MDLKLVLTEDLTKELSARYPTGLFAGVCDYSEEVEQHRGEVWGNPLAVLGLLEVLREQALQAIRESRVSGGDSA